MKETTKNRKYKVGDIIEVGYGITAEVLKVFDRKYELAFSNGVKGIFTYASVKSGKFRIEARYKDAVKDLGNGFTLNVLERRSNGELLCQYCKGNEAIVTGYLNRHEFDKIRVNYNKGDTIKYHGISFTIKHIVLSGKMYLELEYKPFHTTGTVEVVRTEIDVDKRVLDLLIGNNNDVYITKDGKIMQGTTGYDLTDKDVLGVLKKYDFDYKTKFTSRRWLSSEEYLTEYIKLGTLSRSKGILGEDFLYNDSKVRAVAYPCDASDTVVLRHLEGYESLFEVSMFELENYFRRFAE